MLLLPLLALAADEASSAAARLLAAATRGDDPSSWFDTQAWATASWVLIPGYAVAAAPELDAGDTPPFASLEDGVDDAEWEALRHLGAGRATSLLARGHCRAGGVVRTFVASPHPDDAAAFVWSERPGLQRLVLLRLACEEPQQWDMRGKVGLRMHVEGLALTRSAAGWRIAGVYTREESEIWDRLGRDVEFDADAAKAARAAVLDAAEAPKLTRWEPPGLPRQAPARVGDLDGDGRVDVLLPRFGFSTLGVVVGGKLVRVRAESPDGLFGRWAALTGDVDGDGRGDLVVNAHGHPVRGGADVPGAVWVLPGGAGFDPGSHLRVEAPDPEDRSFTNRFVAPGDLDGDGRSDLVVQSLYHRQLLVFFGGALDAPRAVVELPAGEHVLRDVVAAGDVDGDGLADLWIRDEVGGERRRTYLLHGGAQARIEAVPALAAVSPMLAVDLDGDGRSEVLGVAKDDVEAWSAGPTGWTRAWTVAAPRCPQAAAGDFDGDGRPELALGCGYGNGERGEVRIVSADGEPLGRLLGDPEGRLFGLEVVAPGDVDGDGRGELAVVSQDGAALYTDPLTAPAPSVRWSAK